MSGTEIKGPGGVSIKTLARIQDISTAKQIWKGPPKIGKTSTAAALKEVSDEYKLGIEPFFLLFEAGSEGVELNCTSRKCSGCGGSGKQGRSKCEQCDGTGVERLILNDKESVRTWFKWAAESDFNPIVIDTGDRMFQAVSDYICVDQGITSPFGAGDHGLAWSLIYDEMRELLGILEAGNKGVIIIMHVYVQERRVAGGTIQQAVFNVAGKTRSYLAGFVDQILHFDIVPNDDGEGDRHVVYGEQQAGIEAGDRWGLFPAQLDLGESAKDAAEAILERFGYIESE
jgi:hypothetical protein